MKRTLLLLALALASANASAQNVSCTDFSINGIGLDPWDSTQYVVSIQYDGNPNDLIGYPHVHVLLDASGDTAATGYLFFFGQLGGTIQDYPIIPSANMSLTDVTAVFVYGTNNGNDTCLLQFPAPTALHEAGLLNGSISMFPNPASDKILLTANTVDIGSGFSMWDYSGQIVAEGIIVSERTIVDVSRLKQGVYFLSLNGIKHGSIRLIKQ